ncbi:hypothetical protein [Luteibacter sp. E-22]|uniref:hypothetical protein n=1 Tax=Luteibacter sp. E-22 TaxID=3404050 RepID=UPI003CE91168
MSTEKVVRYDFVDHETRFGVETERVVSTNGRYIEYADVAGLVEVIKEALFWDGYDDEGVKAIWAGHAEEALARFQP